MEINDSLDLNKVRLEEEKKLDSILSSKEFRDKAMTAEDHHKFMDEFGNSDSYPGAKIEVQNIHSALYVVRRMYKELGVPDNKYADAAFYHETAHFSEALNWGVNANDSKIKVYFVRSEPSSDIDGIEVRVSLPLPDDMPDKEKRKAVAFIALAPDELSPGDMKIAGLR